MSLLSYIWFQEASSGLLFTVSGWPSISTNGSDGGLSSSFLPNSLSIKSIPLHLSINYFGLITERFIIVYCRAINVFFCILASLVTSMLQGGFRKNIFHDEEFFLIYRFFNLNYTRSRRMNLWADFKLFSNVIYGPNLWLPHKTRSTIIFQLKYTFLQGNKKKRCNSCC